jgi:acetoin utilization protein AcuB
MIVADLMTSRPMTVKSCGTLQIAQGILEAGRFRQLPVVDEGKLIGIVTDRDLRQQVGQPQTAPRCCISRRNRMRRSRLTVS